MTQATPQELVETLITKPEQPEGEPLLSESGSDAFELGLLVQGMIQETGLNPLQYDGVPSSVIAQMFLGNTR